METVTVMVATTDKNERLLMIPGTSLNELYELTGNDAFPENVCLVMDGTNFPGGNEDVTSKN